jgi:pimeloyl-ACP methyl ester carboxylesterase
MPGPGGAGASSAGPASIEIDPHTLLEEMRSYSHYRRGQVGKLVQALDRAFGRHDEALGGVKHWMGEATLSRVFGEAKDAGEASHGHLLMAVEHIEKATREIQEATYDCHLKSGYKVFPIHQDARPDRLADVVFVHGLDGHAFTTWCHDDRRRHDSWPYWLAGEFRDVGVWSLGYAAHKSHWEGQALALPIIARAVVDALKDVVGARPLILVVHSLGGLVVKRAMKDAGDFERFSGYEDHRALREALRAIVFLASPHNGATIATVAQYVKTVFRATPVLEALRGNDPETLVLAEWFRNEATRLLAANELEVLAYRETEKYKGLMVVDAASADPAITGVQARPVPGKNHSTICKCESTDDLIYRDVRALVARAIATARPPTGR